MSQQFCTLGRSRHFTVHDSTTNFTQPPPLLTFELRTLFRHHWKKISLTKCTKKNISFAWSTCLGDATFSLLLRLTASNAWLLDDALHGERDFWRNSGHLRNANKLDKNFFFLTQFFYISVLCISISVSLHVCIAYHTECTGHLVTSITQVTDEIYLFL